MNERDREVDRCNQHLGDIEGYLDCCDREGRVFGQLINHHHIEEGQLALSACEVIIRLVIHSDNNIWKFFVE